MNDYYQPDFYRFNEDSSKLVNWVISRVNNAERILDLGAGCGFIGIELSKFFCPLQLTLVEVQSENQPFLEKNKDLFLTDKTKCEIVIKSFNDWIPEARYDLIVCNPPYYLPGHGEKNKDERKEMARAFVIDGWKILLNKIADALSEDSRAFLVIKNDKRIITAINDSSCLLQKTFHENGPLLFLELMRLDKDRN